MSLAIISPQQSEESLNPITGHSNELASVSVESIPQQSEESLNPINDHSNELASVSVESIPQQSEESLNSINDHSNELALVRFESIQPAALPAISETTLSDSNKDDGQNEDLLCRICWLDGTFDELICLPCKCQGTMGNVHAACLKEWERIRKSRRCEICKEMYLEKRDFLTVLRTFFQCQYAGVFFCKIANIAATCLIAYANIILGEMNISYLISLEKASPNRNGISYPVLILSAAIFPFFLINYLAVDFAVSEMLDCYRIIRDWWNSES